MYTEATTAPTGKPQHLQALDRANGVRSATKNVKLAVRNGSMTVGDALHLKDPDTGKYVVGAMKVLDLMTCQRGVGQTAALKILNPQLINSAKKVRDLSDRQRQVVGEAMAQRTR